MTTVVMQESREEGRKNNYDKNNDNDNDNDSSNNSTTTNNSGRNGTATAPAYHYPVLPLWRHHHHGCSGGISGSSGFISCANFLVTIISSSL